MPAVSRRITTAFTALVICLPATSLLSASANGGTNPKELVKYLNPLQKNQKYLNQSQDRVIKKKALKTQALPQIQPVANKEIGFFAIVPSDKTGDTALLEDLLANSKVNGLSATLPWSQIEPTEDNFNWAPIDSLLSACANHNKTLILRISTCGIDNAATGGDITADTPKWVLDSGARSVTFVSADGKKHLMPVFWDKNYLAKWSNTISALAERYDKNGTLHSIGITGGGLLGGTAVLPSGKTSVDSGTAASNTAANNADDLQAVLKKQYGMNQAQLVAHWKYVADVFPKFFKTARLNFAINAPVHGRAGEDALDEIADYLVYRYGERVYLTRQDLSSGKHGFDDYRLLLKFHHDTLTGISLADGVAAADMPKIAKHALDDGISFAELPVSVLKSDDETVKTALNDLATHIGYQLVAQKTTLPESLNVGEPLKASFAFINAGDATAMRPERNFDKDIAASYRVLLELRDENGKPVLQNVHTPPTPTSGWEPGKAVTWDEELKMVDGNKHQLPAGKYAAFISLIDPDGNRKIQLINATSGGHTSSTDCIEVGKIVVSDSVANSKVPAVSSTAAEGSKQ